MPAALRYLNTLATARRRLAVISLVGLMCVLVSMSVSTPPATADDPNPCDLPSGTLEVGDLPEGTDVDACKAVGRPIENSGIVLDIPDPGTVVGSEELRLDGAYTFEVSVDTDGVVSYSGDGEDSEISEEPLPKLATNPECGQSAYTTNDLKEYGTYNAYVGDGSFPAGQTQAQFADKVSKALLAIETADNNCGLGDNVSANASFIGYTTYESDMHLDSSGATKCGDESTDGRDGVSAWDASDIGSGYSTTLAKTCSWSVPTPGAKNDLIEADVRFNIVDHTFTTSPNDPSCNNNKTDVLSVAVHEAGHVFGLGHVSEADYPYMTMSTQTARCDSTARTLGKGDVKGLESIY